ncbi:MAG TPA: type I polyketide synthase [Ktedonobacteraceae bacterium]|nr:type I polyketide synthase [Ktedonobacteraceae bacterium]
MEASKTFDDTNGMEIAIIGMAGRFPGARNVDELWHNIRDGICCIATFSEEELLTAGVSVDELRQPAYVKARGVLSDIEYFDATFFGYSPREAEIMDPQQRFFLETAYEALENTGYDPDAYDGLIGVYAGTGINSYLLSNLCTHPDLIASIGGLQLVVGSDKDHLTTRVSYKLNLKGPSLDVNTSCSTSLVAVHLACRSLLNGECDMALAGGVSISVPHRTGYLHQDGGITSPDGRCRAFDAQAQGTVPGSGVGIVVLKRLADALADGDTIHAVIKGSAINNDGAQKVGYTAPGLDGQARVIRAAHLFAEVNPETITYLEAHGTATPIGDPIEVAALTQAFRAATNATGFCAIGSVKTNLGHLDAAAGVTGLIKTVMALKHGLLPPSLDFEQPNASIDFAQSPFYVNTTLKEWPTGKTPRRAGVSSFGIGGTNAHIILEEAPAPIQTHTASKTWHLLVLSARTEHALASMTANLATHLEHHPNLDLADVAYTCQVGRKTLRQQRMLVCRDRQEAVELLRTQRTGRVFTHIRETNHKRPIAFMFPGQGTQYVYMAVEVYQEEAIFRQELDRCAQLLLPHLGCDLRRMLYPDGHQVEAAAKQLNQTAFTQPAIFAVEYGLARLWQHWGITPQVLIGHSLGEYVAACLAGIFSLEDALALIALRGKLVQTLPTGAMLSVPLPVEILTPLLNSECSLAATNGPSLCVVSGPEDVIGTLQSQLEEQGVESRLLHISHAFHSSMMEPIQQPFETYLRQIQLKAPQIPCISNVTGTWMTAAEATDPAYWVRHLRQTVLFAEGIQTLLEDPELILLEVGPGQTLRTLAKQQPAAKGTSHRILSSLCHPQERQSESAHLLTTLGKLWLEGVQVRWEGLYDSGLPRRVPLPTYPFERQRYWVEPKSLAYHISNVEPGAGTEESGLAGEDAGDTTRALHHRPGGLTGYMPPGNEIERAIATTWQDLLGIERVSIDDNFFELGGHSLLATQLLSRLRSIFQVQIEFRTLFTRPTVAELAQVVAQSLAEQVDSDLLAELELLSEDRVRATLAREQ